MNGESAEKLFTDAPRRGRFARCISCGAPAPYRVQVVLAAVSRSGKPIQGKMTAQSGRFCEEHALDIWARFGEQLS